MHTEDHYKPHTYQLKKLSSGLQVLLVRDDKLPYISVEMLFGVGAKQDPIDKQGLLSLLVETIDKGTHKQSAVQLAENVELLGSSFIVDLKSDYTSFSMEALSWLDEPLLEIFAEIITKPAFLKEEFDRALKKSIGFAKRRAENISAYSSRVFDRYVYESHPYGYYLTGALKSLKNITHKDIKNFYEKEFKLDRAVLSVSGRYPEDIIEKLEKVFKNQALSLPAVKKQDILASTAPSAEKTELLLVNHPSALQSEVRIGHISVNRSHPDYLALKTANVVLGGAFSSRLMSRVRVQKGLTYGIYSFFFSQKELGAFKIGLAVRNNRVGEALLEIQGVLENFYQQGITSEELEKSKQLLRSQFISNTASSEDFAHYLMYLNNQGMAYSRADEYFHKISQLNLKEVNLAIKKHLQPDKIKILIVSKAEEVKFQLQDYQPFQLKDYKEYL